MMSLRAAVRHERSAPERADGEERRGAHLRVVDDPAAEPRPRRSAGGLLGTLAVVLLLASVFGIVVFQVFLVQAQSHLDQVDRDLARQEARAKDLRLQTADLEAPDRIVADAQARLGMIAPGAPVYLQPHADDDAQAQFDPARDKAPTTTTPPTTVAAGQYGSGQYGTGQYGTGATTPTTTKATTPTTTKATTPTTAKAPTTTAKAPTTTAKTPTTTAKATTTTKVPTTVAGKKP